MIPIYTALLYCMISGKSISQYASHSLTFSSLRSPINREQHEKHLYNQSSHYWKCEVHNRQSTHPNYWYKSGCVALTWCIITFHFAFSSLNVWLIFQAKNNVRSTPACTALIQVLHWSHNARTLTHHLHGSGERNGVQRRIKVSFGRTMVQMLKLLRLAKRSVTGRSDK